MNVKRVIKRIIMILFLVILILLVGIIIMAASVSLSINRQTLDQAFQWQSDHYDTTFYGELEKTDYTIESNDGYVLHVQFLKNPEPTTDYVIISHGYTDNRMGALKYVPTYLDLGFNCIVYDLRGHGENEPTFTTYGIREGEDLDCLIKDTRERYPDITTLGIHGESLGAATTVTCLKYKPNVDFAVADCGFSNIEDVLKHLATTRAHMPAFIVDISSISTKLRYGYALKDMRPIDSLDDNEIPVLFIHGAEDNFILPKHSEDMAARNNGRTEIHMIPGAAHAESVLVEPEMYESIIREFLGR